ncbi:MAG: hypothetical protein NVS9B4_13900 [Candidatus Acidiferrum sp.]
MEAGFDEQRGFDKGYVVGVGLLPYVELPRHSFGYQGVDNGIEASEFSGIGEDDGGEFGAVDDRRICGLMRDDDGGSEFVEDWLIGRLAGLDQRVSQGVGVKNGKAQGAEHRGDGAFAAGDPAGKAES